MPQQRITRLRNLAWMLVGLYLSESIHLRRIAARLPLPARLLSTTRRFRRFLNNRAFRPRVWYRPLAERLLRQAARTGPLRLLVDGSKVGAGHQLLMVGLAYHKRALPIAWTWVKGARGHSGSRKQCALLAYVHKLLPPDASVILAGDSEFGSVAVLQRLERWGWQYVLRQKGNTLACVSHQAFLWQRLDSLIPEKGETFFYEHVILTRQHLYHTHLLTRWERGQTLPWLLATNMDDAQQALRIYRRRMWIEELFGDWKGQGFDLERSHLRHFRRLSRLTFILSLLYLWLISRGSQVIKSGKRLLVDRPGRRDLSIFRIGLYSIHRFCAHSSNFGIRLVPYF